ncbi:hypothetical protein ES703_69044 [subsurface metagenome]
MPKLLESWEVFINHIQVLSDGTAVAAVESSDQQVFLRSEVTKDTASLQRLNNTQLTYFFSVFLIYSLSVPLNAAIGYFPLLNME